MQGDEKNMTADQIDAEVDRVAKKIFDALEGESAPAALMGLQTACASVIEKGFPGNVHDVYVSLMAGIADLLGAEVSFEGDAETTHN